MRSHRAFSSGLRLFRISRAREGRYFILADAFSLEIKGVDIMEEAKTAQGQAHQQKEHRGLRMRRTHAAALAAVIIIIAVIGGFFMATNSAAAQVVAKGDSVSVYYTGTFTNGTVFDSNVGKSPLNFTVGASQMIKGFDEGVVGMRLDENKSITLQPSEAYGPVNQSLIISVPRSEFSNMTIRVGLQVQTSRGEVGTVTAFNSTNVTVDFNSPMAGKTLIFQIRVVAIKQPKA
jgi:FKBP-type peptidyl-prolyl cis-trans isomerase 2